MITCSSRPQLRTAASILCIEAAVRNGGGRSGQCDSLSCNWLIQAYKHIAMSGVLALTVLSGTDGRPDKNFQN